MEGDALGRLPSIEVESDMKIMLDHLPMDPHNPLLNKYPLNLILIHKYQQLDTALLNVL